MASKEYGRKPQMSFVNRYGVGDDYLSMKDAVTKSEVNSRWSEKDSEFEKPYAEGIEYTDMQHFHPSSYGLDDLSITRTGGLNFKICDGSHMEAWAYVEGARLKFPKIQCGGPSVVLSMEGYDGDGDPWGSRVIKFSPSPEKIKALLEMGINWQERVSWVASPLPLKGILDGDIYTPPPCSEMGGWTLLDENISGFTNCGRANIIISVESPCAGPIILSGSDDAVVGGCYPASGGTPPYTWSINKGKINAVTGCITDTTGACGDAIITVVDSCGLTKTKSVKMPTGVWVLQSTIDHGSSCAGNWTCNIYMGGMRIEKLVNCTDESVIACMPACGVSSVPVDPICTPICGAFPIVWCPKTTKTYVWACP